MSPRGKANVALAASLLFLLFSSVSAYLAFSRLDTNRAWTSHTRDVQSALAQVTITTARAGRLRTEFSDSGDLSLLSKYSDGVSKLRTTIASLKSLTTDNSRQLANCTQLEQISEQRIALMDRSIALKRSGSSTLEGQNLITRQIVATAEAMDQLLQQMYNAEDELLIEREQHVRHSSAVMTAVLMVSLFLTLVLFLIHHRLLTSQVQARTQAETAQRTLSARVLHLQDQERRKFARELHDSVGQNLAAMKMALSLLQSDLPEDKRLRDCLKLLDDSIAETRTISYLLHPPMLDEAGLASAVRWFVEGFGKRSAVQLDLDIQEGSQRLAEALELVLFRVLQESLTNVHRHSGATRAEIKLTTTGAEAWLQVKDNGHGIPDELLESLRENGTGGGVGLAGMAERVREIGGKLDIKSNVLGTQVSAVVPVQHRVKRTKTTPQPVQEMAR
jgi:signal transduction histidine kinase